MTYCPNLTGHATLEISAQMVEMYVIALCTAQSERDYVLFGSQLCTPFHPIILQNSENPQTPAVQSFYLQVDLKRQRSLSSRANQNA